MLQLTYSEPYINYSPFGRIYRKFLMYDTIPTIGSVKLVWTHERIHGFCKLIGYVSPHVVKKTFEAL